MNAFSDQPEQPSPGPSRASKSNREVYNIVTDTVVGPNVRVRDNLMQAGITAGGLIAGMPAGWLYARLNGWDEGDQIGCAIVGGFLGLVVGLFSSGIFLMVYRAVRHVRGKHD